MMNKRIKRSKYENTTANKLSLGVSASVRPGRSPGLEASVGKTLSKRSGRSAGQESAKGASLAVRRSKGGPLGYLGVGDPAGRDRFELSKKRAEELDVPHYSKGGSSCKKRSGGKLWIQGAINPNNKGALHKSLGVPEGKKIPLSKLHRAEHSKSPTLRKRAKLAETLRSFHRSRGG